MFALLLILGALALLATGACMVGIALEARQVPHLPLHMRVNPLNILADRRLWTPRIDNLHRVAVWCGVLFLACALGAGGIALLAGLQ